MPETKRVRAALALSVLAALAAAPRAGIAQASAPCGAPEAVVALDHVVLAVADLDRASGRMREAGFTLKEGRLHPNGLRNRHIKLRDRSSIELMTVTGPPRDEMAEGYRDFIAAGDGGAYLALRAPLDRVAREAEALGLDYERYGAGSFEYVTFGDPELAAVFFVAYGAAVEDPDSVLSHRNGASGIASVTLEGAGMFGRLLRAMGARNCGSFPLGVDLQEETIATASGRVILVPPGTERPRVRWVSLRSAGVSSWTTVLLPKVLGMGMEVVDGGDPQEEGVRR